MNLIFCWYVGLYVEFRFHGHCKVNKSPGNPKPKPARNWNPAHIPYIYTYMYIKKTYISIYIHVNVVLNITRSETKSAQFRSSSNPQLSEFQAVSFQLQSYDISYIFLHHCPTQSTCIEATRSYGSFVYIGVFFLPRPYLEKKHGIIIVGSWATQLKNMLVKLYRFCRQVVSVKNIVPPPLRWCTWNKTPNKHSPTISRLNFSHRTRNKNSPTNLYSLFFSHWFVWRFSLPFCKSLTLHSPSKKDKGEISPDHLPG